MTDTAQFLANLIKEHVGVGTDIVELNAYLEADNIEGLGTWFMDFQDVMPAEEARTLVRDAEYYATPHDKFGRVVR